MASIQQKLGKRIKLLRELKGFTQEQIEEKSDINPSYLSALERGQKNVTIEVLERVADALEVELFQLFFFESDTDMPSKNEISKILETLDKKKATQILNLLKMLG